MAKRKKNLSEIKNRPDTGKKTINPFEVHFNRQKFIVLNRQLKTDRGLPGVSKAKALKKRKETLLQEYKVLNKSNKFVDRRIGENISSMTKEDRIIARFSAERMKSHRRKDKFNLADDEVLTHKGQSIAEIEKFDDPPTDDDEGDVKGLDARFVEEANFGGGILKESKNNRATIIEQLIAESKKRKAEKQLAKERTLQKTEELDAEWKELIPVVNMGKHDDVIEKKDPYDIILNDLKFEPRGTPSNKLKTEAEIAAEEAQKLQELEEERLRRMRGDDRDTKTINQHRSADDLDDGFEIEEDNFELLYDKDGNIINFDKIEGMKKENGSKLEDSSEAEEEMESGDESDVEETGSTHDESNENEYEESSRNDEADEDSDDLSDLKVNDEGSNDSDSETEAETLSDTLKKKGSNKTELDMENKNIDVDLAKIASNQFNTNSSKERKQVSFDKELVRICDNSILKIKKTEEIEMDKEERTKQMEKARKELPYAFEVPKTDEELQDLMKERSLDEQAVIIERMIKCNHPSLNDKNKEKLEHLFTILMQHLNDTEPTKSWALLDRLAPYLFDLTQFSPDNSAFCLSEVILEKHSDFLKRKQKYPTPETFLFLKLIPLLFPTSDKRHSVTTPAFIFISELLHNCHVTTRRAIASGLFLVSLVTEYVYLSKRIMPEALNFICGIIHMATSSTDLRVVPPFKKEHKFLFLHKSQADQNDLDLSMQVSDLEHKPGQKIDDAFRIRSIYCALKLTEVFGHYYEDLPACKLLFEPIKKQIEVLDISKYPVTVQKSHMQVLEFLESLMKKSLDPIIMEAKKPKALRLYEPLIKPVYDMKKKDWPPEQAEHSKLLHKYKQEMKGALREIRRDREFISKLKFKERAASDAERKRKVKEIYSWGAQQQSEFNKLKRKKK